MANQADTKRAPFQILEPEEIELVSIATGRRVTLDVAAVEGWVVCDHCGVPYDPEDVALLREDDPEAPCISDVCVKRPAGKGGGGALVGAPLPVDRIVLFAQGRMHERFRQGLLFRLFYAHDESRSNPLFNLREISPEPTEGAARLRAVDTTEPTVREEQWASQGLVVVKRRRGKFVSWVPLAGS